MASSLNGTGVSFSDGTSQASAWVGLKYQLFTASGTFTVPTGVTSVKVTCIGGGSAGATSYGPGCAGGAAIGIYTVTPGAGITVTVGAGSAVGSASSSAGGTSSFGAFCSATGGSGRNSSASSYQGGIGSGGNIQNIRGMTNNGYGFAAIGIFTGCPARYGNAASSPAIAWSTSLESPPYGGGNPTQPILPGAAGGAGLVGCSTFYMGAVGGVVLVEW